MTCTRTCWRLPRRPVIFHIGMHCLPLILGAVAVPPVDGATKTWSNAGGSNHWDDATNWSGGVPTSIDTALFSTLGSGGTILLVNSSGTAATVNAATLTINSTPNNYNHFEAATSYFQKLTGR